MPTLVGSPNRLVLLDQRRLPREELYVTCETAEAIAEAIRNMTVRGAPAIGVTAAYGLALGMRGSSGAPESPRSRFDRLAEMFARTRPTAVNLYWAIDRMRRRFEAALAAGSLSAGLPDILFDEARSIEAEDLACCRALGDHGASLLPDPAVVLTHCNAGALATVGWGTALGIVRSAVALGKRVSVLADETRPFLQGARLTAWELAADGIPVTLITDNMAGHFLASGEIDAVIVGADRIAANGDTANKIGTYSVAVLSRENGVPFYVAAPTSTIDSGLGDGRAIPIEERSSDEVTSIAGVRIAPDGVSARHPAFDVTPARYITAIVTERGIARPPFDEAIARLELGRPPRA